MPIKFWDKGKDCGHWKYRRYNAKLSCVYSMVSKHKKRKLQTK